MRRFYEAQAKGALDVLEQLLAPAFVDHSLLPEQDPGREGYIQSTAEERGTFSNIRYIIEEQVAKGEKVMTRATMKRVHDRGEFRGVAPTGRELTTSGIVGDTPRDTLVVRRGGLGKRTISPF